MAVIDSLNALACDPPAQMESFAEDLIGGFRSAAANATAPGDRNAWRYLQFVASILPMVAASRQGRFGVAFDFVSLGLSESERGPRGTVEVTRFAEWLATPIVSRSPLLEDLLSWGSGFWYLAWAGGAYTGAGVAMKDLFSGLLLCPFWTFQDGVSAMGNFGEWLIESNTDLEQAREVGAALERARETCGVSQIGVECALYVQGRLGRIAGIDRTASAAHARRHPSAQVRLQVAVGDWLGRAGSVEDLLRDCADAQSELDRARESTEQKREVLFRVLNPVVHNLARAGRHGDLLRVLGAWNYLPGDLDSPQVLVPWAAGGAMLVLPSGKVRRGAEADLRTVVDAYNHFRQATIVVRGEDYEPGLPGRPGLVTGDGSAEYAKRIDALIEGVGMVGDSSVPLSTVPVEGHPFQTVMAARGRGMSPWSVSFRTPNPDAPIRKVAIVVADPLMECLEAVHVERIFAATGAEVCRVRPGDCSAGAFRDVWCDPSNDVVWVSGHGDFDGRAPSGASIVLGEDGVPFSSVRGWELPQRRCRRLAVLNVCYGGAAAALEGLGGMGLATAVAGRGQAVASHLWNSHWLSASCFGVLFAEALCGRGFFEAFENACDALRQGAPSIEARLRACDAADLADRVRNNSSLDWADLAVWGSPCFLQ
ncbi:MAG: hypothetical protein H6811_12280 [Phycisphaeraceae bacterium]|nr:hypothetical protein [Phycisphaeraceae bacterium]